MDIRAVGPDDVDTIAAFALKALPDRLGVRVSEQKVRSWVAYMAETPGHFQRAAFDDSGAPVAALALYVSEMPFHCRCEGHIVFCYSECPGAGLYLLRSMKEWVDGDIRIQRVIWAQNDKCNAGMSKLGQRIGFTDETTNLIYYKCHSVADSTPGSTRPAG